MFSRKNYRLHGIYDTCRYCTRCDACYYFATVGIPYFVITLAGSENGISCFQFEMRHDPCERDRDFPINGFRW